MTEKEIDLNVSNEVAKLAWHDKLTLQNKISLLKTFVICLCIALSVGFYFAADCAKETINRHYDYLESLVFESETIVVTETVTKTISEAVAEFDEAGNPKAQTKSNVVTGGDQ